MNSPHIQQQMNSPGRFGNGQGILYADTSQKGQKGIEQTEQKFFRIAERRRKDRTRRKGFFCPGRLQLLLAAPGRSGPRRVRVWLHPVKLSGSRQVRSQCSALLHTVTVKSRQVWHDTTAAIRFNTVFRACIAFNTFGYVWIWASLASDSRRLKMRRAAYRHNVTIRAQQNPVNLYRSTGHNKSREINPGLFCQFCNRSKAIHSKSAYKTFLPLPVFQTLQCLSNPVVLFLRCRRYTCFHIR